MKAVVVAAVLSVLSVAAACADPPLAAAPGASMVLVARTADAVALFELLVRAQLVPPFTEGGAALVATAPVVVSFLPGTVVVVAARVDPSALSKIDAKPRPVIGSTQAFVLGGQTVLARVDRNRALLAFNVKPGAEATAAAALEVMAADKAAQTPALPAAGQVALHVNDGVLPIQTGAVDVTATVSGNDVTLHATALHPDASLRLSLESEAPPWACFLDDGAAATISVPPLFTGPDDSFQGRMTIAVYDGAATSIAIAGAPKDAAAQKALLESVTSQAGPAATTTVEGTRTTVDAAGRRHLHAVVDEGLFVLATGDAVPVAGLLAGIAAKKPCASTHSLARANGSKLARVLLPLLVTPQAIIEALSAGPRATEMAAVRGVERFDLDAAVAGTTVAFDAHVAFSPVQD